MYDPVKKYFSKKIMYTIIGLKKAFGTFKDDKGNSINYDNVKFYVIDENNVNGIGQCPEVVSVKSSLCDDVYNATSIGKNVNFSYNKYGKVQSVDVF